MGELQKGDRIRIKEKLGCKVSGWKGEVIEVKEDPSGWLVVKADQTGYDMAFPENEVEKI